MFLRRTIHFILSVAVLASFAIRPAAGVDTAAAQEETAKAKAAVAKAEQRLQRVTELSAQGAVPTAQVHRAQIDVAEARIDLAAIQGQQQEIVSHLEKLVAHWERFWERVKDLSEQGVIPTGGADDPRAELARARIRLEGQTLVLLREKQLGQFVEAAKAGAVPQRRVEEARGALEEARKQAPVRRRVALAAEEKGPSDKLKELLKERLVTAGKIHDLVLQAYKGGGSVDQVIQAQAALLNAKLNLSETKEDRIKVHQEMVKLSEDWLAVVEKLAKAQQASQIDVLRANAHLLDARIGLEKAKESK